MPKHNKMWILLFGITCLTLVNSGCGSRDGLPLAGEPGTGATRSCRGEAQYAYQKDSPRMTSSDTSTIFCRFITPPF